jgi:hypothetical protein
LSLARAIYSQCPVVAAAFTMHNLPLIIEALAMDLWLDSSLSVFCTNNRTQTARLPGGASVGSPIGVT